MSVNHVGQGEEVIRAESGAGMQERESGTRWSLPLVWMMETPGSKSAKKAAQKSYHPLKLGCEKKYSRDLQSVQTTKLPPAR